MLRKWLVRFWRVCVSHGAVSDLSSKKKFDACRSKNEDKTPKLLFLTFRSLKIIGERRLYLFYFDLRLGFLI